MTIPYPNQDASNGKDMRYFPRWEVQNPVLYHLEGKTEAFDGQTKDLSCAGACVMSKGKVVPHQRIKMTVELAEGMKINLRNLWSRMPLTRADVQMLHGVLRQMVRWKERG